MMSEVQRIRTQPRELLEMHKVESLCAISLLRQLVDLLDLRIGQIDQDLASVAMRGSIDSRQRDPVQSVENWEVVREVIMECMSERGRKIRTLEQELIIAVDLD
jgi:hypothetical protein